MALLLNLLAQLASTCYTLYLYLLLIFFTTYLFKQYFNKGLNKYPGPLMAKFTDFWRVLDVYNGRAHVTHNQLHKKYGDVVRFAPNMLSFADPRAIKDIYGLNKGFVKSPLYPVQAATTKGKTLQSLFTTTDENWHASLRRAVSNAFSMTSVVHYEPLIDETMKVFFDQTDKVFASQGKICNFCRWLEFYAFDVVGNITYSKRHGFIEENKDVDGILAALDRLFHYGGLIGQVPWLDKFLRKNPILVQLSRWGFLDNPHPVTLFAKARMEEKISENTQYNDANTKLQRGDLMTMFLKAQAARPDIMTPKHVLTMAVSIVFAGSETTAITLGALFYHLLREPRCMEQIRKEVDEAIQTGKMEDHPSGLISWEDAQKLPYLDACVKEAFRLHPAPGLIMERVVPPQGASIMGEWVPGGTIVGCNAWVLHRREQIFGQDVDVYRPERWLIDDADRLRAMNGSMFQFGAGSRTCLGKNISLMEIYKLVPSFIRRFDMALANPDSEKKLETHWFAKQTNFEVRFSPRARI